MARGIPIYQVRRLTGATARQLRYWDQTGLARASIQRSGGKSGVEKRYSQSDVELITRIVRAIACGMTVQALHRKGVPSAEVLDRMRE